MPFRLVPPRWGLVTDPVRALQHALYRAAKADPGRRFHALGDKVFRRDVLERAWEDVRRNGGAAGIDRVTIADVEEYGVSRLLDEVAARLQEGVGVRFRPAGCSSPSPAAERRPLSIPSVADRVVQAAVKIVLEPIFEADMLACSFGFRPKRAAHDALQVSSMSPGGADGGWWRRTSPIVWMLGHTASFLIVMVGTVLARGAGGSMRSPFRRPVRT